MKLFFSQTSPFVRKVMVLAHEAGIADKIEKISAAAHPIDRDENVVIQNPLGKIPTLVLDDDSVLFDSRVIAAFLDTQHEGAPLIPASGIKRFAALTLEALADGLSDAAVLVRYELTLRDEDKRNEPWLNGQMAKIDTALDELEAHWMEILTGPMTLGQIAVGCALGYLDFRFADINWREARPQLAAWYDAFAKRPSMEATAPPA
ncbi:glutathione S-transferase [Rhodobium gokarnense]|uniref:Glutathione S-transferase n=1 Tax=Rhodobium gokarnense TaxID=364296 RepID=A0ABT3HIA6_9HYPH|nr:glutathione S-transferase [Rhodobium gokarnense]MCW2310125.1 glutathione S-transferase [Rhodobium gokarnense]